MELIGELINFFYWQVNFVSAVIVTNCYFVVVAVVVFVVFMVFFVFVVVFVVVVVVVVDLGIDGHEADW